MQEMTMQEEIMELEQPSIHPLLPKWLTILRYCCMANILVAVLNLIPGALNWVSWPGYFLAAVTVYVFFQLGHACARYRKSAIFKIVYLGILILGKLFGSMVLLVSLFGIAGSVCSIIASGLEYYGHAEVVDAMDKKLAKQWRALFVWSILVGVLVGLGAVVAVVVSAIAGGNVSAELVVAVISLPSLVVQIVYFAYLSRMLRLMQ